MSWLLLLLLALLWLCLPWTALRAVKRLVNENRLPHLLLYGPPGTGKTSTILAVARQMYGSSMSSMTLELNASDDRGIEVVRRQVVDFASTKTIFRCRAVQALALAQVARLMMGCCLQQQGQAHCPGRVRCHDQGRPVCAPTRYGPDVLPALHMTSHARLTLWWLQSSRSTHATPASA